MHWTAISRKSLWRASVLALFVVDYWIMPGHTFSRFTANEAEGLNTLILLLGSIYAVMYAFVIYVIWGQFTDVERFVMRECYSLDDLLRFSRYVNADASRAIRRAVSDYSGLVIESEWQQLGKRERDTAAENAFTLLLSTVISVKPANTEEETIHQRLIDIAREAGDHRDERITKSLTRIPPTLTTLVDAISLALFLLVWVYPFRQPIAGSACFTLIVAILIFANIAMTDLDNPFEGVHNVNSQPFSRLH
jgi:hypothetical protein